VTVLELVSHSLAISSGRFGGCADRAHKSCSIHNVFLFPAGIEGRLPSRWGYIASTLRDDPTEHGTYSPKTMGRKKSSSITQYKEDRCCFSPLLS